MPHGEAKKAIDELSVELKRIPEETGTLEGILDEAKEGIEELTPESLKDLIDSLQEEFETLEVEHPRVTALMNQVMNALSGLGI